MSYYECHKATEIIPGLILGGIRDVRDMIHLGVEVLVSLDSLPSWIWETGFRGKIWYCPIEDGGVLPDDVLETMVEKICVCLYEGRKIGIFCIGGHGRTGYMAACVLSRFGNGTQNPFSFLHQHYCVKAIETDAQADAVVRFIMRQDNLRDTASK